MEIDIRLLQLVIWAFSTVFCIGLCYISYINVQTRKSEKEKSIWKGMDHIRTISGIFKETYRVLKKEAA